MTDTTPPPDRPPLWEAMAKARLQVLAEYHYFCSEELMFAAEIRAMADAVVPEEPEHQPLIPSVPMNSHDYGMACQRGQRQAIRALLLAEAQRAEEGR